MEIEFGLEREMLLYDSEYKPYNLKEEDIKDGITVDFFDNQIEVVTGVYNKVEKLMYELMQKMNTSKLINNKIWPLSQPGMDTHKLQYGVRGGDYFTYRDYLCKKYGKDYMATSGIHVNISLSNHDSEEYYFNLMKKILIFSPLILQFFSYTPLYQKGINDKGLKDIGLNRGFDNSLSLRNSYEYGYINENKYELNYLSLEKFLESKDELLKTDKLTSFAELYSKIRLKKGINNTNYIELRFFDINPYNMGGISIDDIIFLKNIILYIDKLDIEVDTNMINLGHSQFEQVAIGGQNKEMLLKIGDSENSLRNHTINFLEKVIITNNTNDKEKYVLETYLNNYINNNLDINKMLNEIKKEKLTIFNFGKKYVRQKEEFILDNEYENMELSTRILMAEAIKENIDINIISSKFNVLELVKNDRKELVIQATKTNLDKYVNILVMENKNLTKLLLDKNNINTAQGMMLSKDEAVDYSLFKDKKMIVKPLDTNFGLGITTVQKSSLKEVIDSSLEYAFKFSDNVLVEEFFEGEEYRFLVVDGKVISIVKRIPANVVGDGVNTVEKLVQIKNSDKRRGEGYITPLEKIKITDVEKGYLKRENKDIDYIPGPGEKVYLRENSNVSNGGDSIEMFDFMSGYFKNIAKKVAEVLDVKICGVDMIINKDYSSYIIVEANFNPAIQMHTYPYYGIGRNPAPKILKMLFD